MPIILLCVIDSLNFIVYCNDQEITVAEFKKNVGVDFFRRCLHPPLLDQWGEVKRVVDSWLLSNEPDQVVWNLGKNKRFTTKSVYAYMEKHLACCDYRWIWKAKLPLKIQIFL